MKTRSTLIIVNLMAFLALGCQTESDPTKKYPSTKNAIPKAQSTENTDQFVDSEFLRKPFPRNRIFSFIIGQNNTRYITNLGLKDDRGLHYKAVLQGQFPSWLKLEPTSVAHKWKLSGHPESNLIASNNDGPRLFPPTLDDGTNPGFSIRIVLLPSSPNKGMYQSMKKKNKVYQGFTISVQRKLKTPIIKEVQNLNEIMDENEINDNIAVIVKAPGSSASYAPELTHNGTHALSLKVKSSPQYLGDGLWKFFYRMDYSNYDLTVLKEINEPYLKLEYYWQVKLGQFNSARHSRSVTIRFKPTFPSTSFSQGSENFNYQQGIESKISFSIKDDRRLGVITVPVDEIQAQMAKWEGVQNTSATCKEIHSYEQLCTIKWKTQCLNHNTEYQLKFSSKNTLSVPNDDPVSADGPVNKKISMSNTEFCSTVRQAAIDQQTRIKAEATAKEARENAQEEKRRAEAAETTAEEARENAQEEKRRAEAAETTAKEARENAQEEKQRAEAAETTAEEVRGEAQEERQRAEAAEKRIKELERKLQQQDHPPEM